MRKRTKYLFRPICLLSVLALVGLAACGDDNDSGDSASQTNKDYKITLVPGIRGDKYYVALQCGAEAEARRLGVTLTMQGGREFDPSSQTPVLQAVSATKPDAIVVAPVDSKAMFIPLQTASKAGAKIVLVDTTLDNTSFVVSSIRSDYAQGGVKGADILNKLMGGKGETLLISIKPGLSTLDAGKEGFERGIKRYKSIKHLGTEYGNNDQVKVASIVAAKLQSNPNLKGIFLPSGPDAEGVISALRRAKKIGKVKVVAYDAYPNEVEQVRKGQVQALIVQKPYEMGQLGVRMAVDALNGKTPTKEILTDLLVATKDNLKSPEITPFLYRSC